MLLAKEKELHRILSAKNVNLWKLRELALSEGGLLNGMFVYVYVGYLFVCLLGSVRRNYSFRLACCPKPNTQCEGKAGQCGSFIAVLLRKPNDINFLTDYLFRKINHFFLACQILFDDEHGRFSSDCIRLQTQYIRRIKLQHAAEAAMLPASQVLMRKQKRKPARTYQSTLVEVVIVAR